MTALFRLGLALLLGAGLSAGAHAQAPPRKFTQYALRGAIVFLDYPQITVNGHPMRLAPGARVRNQHKLIVSAATLRGERVLAHYTLDLAPDQVRDVWVLRPSEAAVIPWPVSMDEARAWTFNDSAQTWTPP
jgi:hypothetical protein